MIVVIGALIRLAWVAFVHPPGGDNVFGDMKLYVDQARAIAEGGDLRPSYIFQPIGAHMLLAGIFVLFGTGDAGIDAATAVWWAMSATTPVFLGLFVGQLAGRLAGAIAAGICALSPLYISYTSYFLGEVPGTFFLALAMFLLLRAAREQARTPYLLWAGAGASAGLMYAFRPQMAIVFIVALAFGLVGLRRNWRGVLAGVVAGAVMLSGIIVHNSLAMGKLTGFGGNSGNVFFHGQCHARELLLIGPPEAGRIRTISSVEVQHDRGRNYFYRTNQRDLQGFLFDRGFDCIRDHGLGHVRYWGENVLDGLAATTPYPQYYDIQRWHGDMSRIANSSYSWLLCLVALAAFIEVIRRRRRGAPTRVLGFLLVASLMWVPLAMVFFGAPRYRLPFDIFGFALFAVLITSRQSQKSPASSGDPPR